MDRRSFLSALPGLAVATVMTIPWWASGPQPPLEVRELARGFGWKNMDCWHVDEQGIRTDWAVRGGKIRRRFSPFAN